MNDQFYIYSKRIEDFQTLLELLSKHYSEEFFRNKDQMTLFEIEEPYKIQYFNREIELKSQRYTELMVLRNELIDLHQEFQSMQAKLKANQTILKTIPRVDQNHEVENPYVHILKEEIRDIEISLEEFNKLVMVVYVPGGGFYLIHLKSRADRQKVIDYILEYITEWNTEDLIEDYQAYFTQSNLAELRFHNIDIEEAVKAYNEKVKQEIESKRIQQYWEITYEVKYTIPNLLHVMQSEEWEDKINDYRNCKVQGDSIIFEYTSEEELTGIDIYPDDENLSIKLHNECVALYEDYLSEPFELSLLERIIDKTEQYELKVTDYCFGNE
jgi:vacuolar-type H+-ATPase subunit I/STV1